MTIETKFNIGQKVVFIGDYFVDYGIITNIRVNINYDKHVVIYYEINGKELAETRVYATKNDILKHIENELKNIIK